MKKSIKKPKPALVFDGQHVDELGKVVAIAIDSQGFIRIWTNVRNEREALGIASAGQSYMSWHSVREVPK